MIDDGGSLEVLVAVTACQDPDLDREIDFQNTGVAVMLKGTTDLHLPRRYLPIGLLRHLLLGTYRIVLLQGLKMIELTPATMN